MLNSTNFNLLAKHAKSALALVLLIIFVTAAGCSKKDNNPLDPLGGNPGGGGGTYSASITLNGDGFVNTTFNGTGSLTVAYGGFSAKDQMTVYAVNCVNAKDTVVIYMTTEGKKTGSFKWVDFDGANLGANSVFMVKNNDYMQSWVCTANAGTTNITAFGNVGGVITGTLSGKLQSTASTSAANTVNISGSFSVYRVPDSN